MGSNEKKDNFKPQRLRFTDHDNICLLREVVQENPFKDSSAWDKVQKNLQILTGKLYLIKTLKNHIERLLDQFTKQDEIDLKRSGIEEPHSELDQLLCEIALIASEYKGNKKAKKITKEQQISEIGKKVRDRYAENLKVAPFVMPDNNQDESPVRVEYIFDDHCYASANTPMDIVLLETPVEEVPQNVPNNSAGADTNTAKFCRAGANNSVSVNASEDTKIITDGNNNKENILGNSAGTSTTKSSTVSHPQRNILVPVRKRQRKDPAVKKSCLTYLTDKQEKDREIKLREIRIEEKRLELEERKLSLEEKKNEIEQTKIEIDVKERQQKLMIDQEKAKLELEERKVITKLLQAQQEIIDNFSKLQNKNSN